MKNFTVAWIFLRDFINHSWAYIQVRQSSRLKLRFYQRLRHWVRFLLCIKFPIRVYLALGNWVFEYFPDTWSRRCLWSVKGGPSNILIHYYLLITNRFWCWIQLFKILYLSIFVKVIVVILNIVCMRYLSCFKKSILSFLSKFLSNSWKVNSDLINMGFLKNQNVA